MLPNGAWVYATENSGEILYLSFPSSDSNKAYLVGCAVKNNKMYFAHDCPGYRFSGNCKHLKTAHKMFSEKLDRDPTEKIVVIRKHLSLSPEWKQIPLDRILGGRSHVAVTQHHR
jgi:hypothetical protein